MVKILYNTLVPLFEAYLLLYIKMTAKVHETSRLNQIDGLHSRYCFCLEIVQLNRMQWQSSSWQNFFPEGKTAWLGAKEPSANMSHACLPADILAKSTWSSFGSEPSSCKCWDNSFAKCIIVLINKTTTIETTSVIDEQVPTTRMEGLDLNTLVLSCYMSGFFTWARISTKNKQVLPSYST